MNSNSVNQQCEKICYFLIDEADDFADMCDSMSVVMRAVLAELAINMAKVERDDGTFDKQTIKTIRDTASVTVALAHMWHVMGQNRNVLYDDWPLAQLQLKAAIVSRLEGVEKRIVEKSAESSAV